MPEHELVEIIRRADDAINREDFDAGADFYADDATLVLAPGRVVTGKARIRAAMAAIAAHFGHNLHVSQRDYLVIEGGDTALVLARATIATKAEPVWSEERRATYVFRRVDGRWLCVVDNSYGTGLLPAG
jgi:uncharacterized protein (TIGR02246 family)